MGEELDVNNLQRGELSYNTLNECVIRVDFMKINKMDELLNQLNEMLNGYSFKANEVFNIDLEIHDPKTLITQELIKNNINKSINYEYYTPTEKFIINEYVLLFSKQIFVNYTGIGKYQELFNQILDKIKELEPEIKITRVGLRKKNIIFTKKEYNWRNILNEDYIPKNIDNEIDEINIESKILNENTDSYSYNHLLSIKKGNAKKDNQDIVVNRIICDIDYYKRIIDKNNINLTEYNEQIFENFKKMMNKSFLLSLKTGEIDNDNIVWGTNLNDNSKQ